MGLNGLSMAFLTVLLTFLPIIWFLNFIFILQGRMFWVIKWRLTK